MAIHWETKYCISYLCNFRRVDLTLMRASEGTGNISEKDKLDVLYFENHHHLSLK